MTQFALPLRIRFPKVPSTGPPEWIAWANILQDAIRDQNTRVVDRVVSMITVGTIADRPAADGTYRFYFSTDEAPEVLYFDDGTWNPL